MRSIPGRHTQAQWLALCEAFHFRCAYCLLPAREGWALVKDHIIPVARKEESSDDIWNILPACVSCHSRKLEGSAVTLGSIRRIQGSSRLFTGAHARVASSKHLMVGTNILTNRVEWTKTLDRSFAEEFRMERLDAAKPIPEYELQGIKDA